MKLDKEEFEKAIGFYIKETYGWFPEIIIPNVDHNGEIEFVYCESDLSLYNIEDLAQDDNYDCK